MKQWKYLCMLNTVTSSGRVRTPLNKHLNPQCMHSLMLLDKRTLTHNIDTLCSLTFYSLSQKSTVIEGDGEVKVLSSISNNA